METAKLKKFAQAARRGLREQVSTRLKSVLSADSMAKRENPKAVAELEKQIKERGKDQVVEAAAYVWFNRFCALRFMDANNYTRIRVMSPVPGQFQPEILAEAKMGHIDDDLGSVEQRQRILDILSSERPDAQGEAYRLLLVAACNAWNKAMPFLFEKIADYTELLLPDDLLSGNSILAYTREALTPAACEDVEVIGWLYQFYISEKKDEVFEGLKKNKKITPDNIPAATQLFTPHWIVRYLVENSLGRLWMLNRPGSKLVEQMEYYIAPDNDQPTTYFLRVSSPEEIRICDPACGSGHMLTYAFDLLHAIYEEEGYEPAEIPEKILTHNLYGIEIDERAGELAAFALTMKARSKQRRFFSKGVTPNICILQNVQFDESELKAYMDEIGRDLFSAPLQTTLRQFEEADNFGSLIVPQATDVAELKNLLDAKDMGGNLLLHTTHKKVLQALEMADYLSPKYQVVVANPPYMGSGGMNKRLAAWARDNYPDSKSDLFAIFIERNLVLAQECGLVAMITMQSWMFLSSYEELRQYLLGNTSILSMAHLGTRSFDSIGGEVVSTTAFVLSNAHHPELLGDYVRLVEGKSEVEKQRALLHAVEEPHCGWLFHSAVVDFGLIPGSPIAYWVSDAVINAFCDNEAISDSMPVNPGIRTGKDPWFVRFWFEVSNRHTQFGLTDSSQMDLSSKWFPLHKGGSFRKWYGNAEHVIDLWNDGENIKTRSPDFRLREKKWYFKPFVSWSRISASDISFRYYPNGVLFSDAGPGIFAGIQCHSVMALLNSCLGPYFLKIINPTMNYQKQNVEVFPCAISAVSSELTRATDLEKLDWDSYETSWDFTGLPLLQPADYFQALENSGGNVPNIGNGGGKKFQPLEKTYAELSNHWKTMTLEMQRLEEANNRIFIDAYGLQDELTPEVPLNEITLTCNPHYRYGGKKTDEELEALQLADTMKEFISYAVGCMFGRYSLDKPGLILANQGETVEDYFRKIQTTEYTENTEADSSLSCNSCDSWSKNEPASDISVHPCSSAVKNRSCTFLPDDDNVIPILDGDWFTDDAAERFRTFLRVTFGETHYEENLRFLEEAIGKDIEKYFLKDFYVDHIKRYKKRPIYWLFSSPAGSFNALIYMHRYRPDTVSVVLNDYLREFRTKLSAKLEHLLQVGASADASKSDKTKALKEIEKIKKVLDELDTYEHETLYPLAGQQIEIDLDDGVKVNYPKFGKALKKIAGLS